MPEYSKTCQTPYLESETERRPQDPETVSYRSAEVDGRGFREVAGGAGYLPHIEVVEDGLCKEFVIKQEIIRVLMNGQLFQYLPGKCPVPRMKLRQL